jgi:hypothetical protein
MSGGIGDLPGQPRDPGTAGRDGVSTVRRPAGRGRSRRLEAGNGHVARACCRARGWPCRRARGWRRRRTCRWLCRRARRSRSCRACGWPCCRARGWPCGRRRRPAGRRPGEAAGQARDHRSTRSSGLAYWSGMCAASVSGRLASRRRDRWTRWRGERAALIAASRTGRSDGLGRAGPACALRRVGRTHPRTDPCPMRRMRRRRAGRLRQARDIGLARPKGSNASSAGLSGWRPDLTGARHCGIRPGAWSRRARVLDRAAAICVVAGPAVANGALGRDRRPTMANHGHLRGARCAPRERDGRGLRSRRWAGSPPRVRRRTRHCRADRVRGRSQFRAARLLAASRRGRVV